MPTAHWPVYADSAWPVYADTLAAVADRQVAGLRRLRSGLITPVADTRYALERLLYRLSLSPHRERFVLKGAMLLAT